MPKRIAIIIYVIKFDVDVLRKFKEGDRFICQRGEVTPSTTAMYALYRASQIRFKGDVVLEEAYDFSRKFLQDWLEGDEHLDKWVISKNLPHEVVAEVILNLLLSTIISSSFIISSTDSGRTGDAVVCHSAASRGCILSATLRWFLQRLVCQDIVQVKLLFLSRLHSP